MENIGVSKRKGIDREERIARRIVRCICDWPRDNDRTEAIIARALLRERKLGWDLCYNGEPKP
jgi:hypothetical protein